MQNESTNEAKHTPGPWPLRDIGHGIRIDDIAWIGFGSAHSKDEHRANAYLIAISPTMHAYIQERAAGGCSEAKLILDALL